MKVLSEETSCTMCGVDVSIFIQDVADKLCIGCVAEMLYRERMKSENLSELVYKLSAAMETVLKLSETLNGIETHLDGSGVPHADDAGKDLSM